MGAMIPALAIFHIWPKERRNWQMGQWRGNCAQHCSWGHCTIGTCISTEFRSWLTLCLRRFLICAGDSTSHTHSLKKMKSLPSEEISMLKVHVLYKTDQQMNHSLHLGSAKYWDIPMIKTKTSRARLLEKFHVGPHHDYYASRINFH
jgi:hypothetical protein